ncbi:MAG TPA: PCRF domain-containing protein, partial [Acidimicrobiales bacterium]|nr:PCRF domain-containing protein [Acidimicrobiales bacterium]
MTSGRCADRPVSSHPVSNREPMKDFTETLSDLGVRVDQAHEYLRIDYARDRVRQLEAEASRPDLWDDPESARRVTGELSDLQDDIRTYEELRSELEDAETLFLLAQEEGDESLEAELESAVESMDTRLAELELRSLFSGEHDENDAVCDINSGAGGTDAQDWAEMLLRMYTRWAS